jgi:molybdate transport system regulatory protein
MAMEPKVKLWMEEGGLLVFSDYRMQLLQHVADTESLAQAAGRMGLSYRRAWGKIKEIERNLGFRLVQSEVGGVGGGRTRLTRKGENLLAQYRRFRAAVEVDVDREFVQAFSQEP